MHVISLKMLRDFWHKHPEAEQPLRKWHTVAEHTRFVDFANLRQCFGSADYAAPYTAQRNPHCQSTAANWQSQRSAYARLPCAICARAARLRDVCARSRAASLAK